jgi:hypothetical protein
MTRGQEVLDSAQTQDQALDMTRKPAGKLHGKYCVCDVYGSFWHSSESALSFNS